MKLTNAELGETVNALKEAIELATMKINSELPLNSTDYDEQDRDNHAIWTGQRRRYRALRKKFLAEEKRR
jgi:hypothetical protein